MMLDPAMVVKYIVPILVLTLVTIVGKLFFSSMGVLLSGQSLKNAVHCGCSLAQIGEFAFIIASLGLSLGVIADYIYPIIIAVSVITTLTTPFFIKHSDNIYAFVVKILPEKLTQKLERYTDEEQSEKEQDSDWSAFLSRYIRTVALYGVVMVGIGIIGRYWLLPLLETALPSASAAKAVTLAVIYLGMALFIRPMLDTRSPQYTVLWMKKRSFRLPLMALSGIRILLIALIAFIPLRNIAGIGSAWLLPVIVAALLLASRMGWLASAYLNVEARFLTNLNERQLQHFSESGEYEQWLDEKLCVDSFSLPAGFAGQSLKDLGWGRRFGVNVIKLVHGKRRKNMPAGNTALAAGDTVYVVGERENLRTLRLSLGLEERTDAPTLREYTSSESEAEGGLYSYALHVDKGDSLDGRSIKDSGIRENYDCMILGLQRGNLPIVQPDVNMTIQDNDIVWLLGTRVMAGKVLRDADV